MDNTLHQTAMIRDERAPEPLLRPFELVAIGCGVATLVGTFLVSGVLFKGLLIGGSLLTLLGSLLYFGLARRDDGLPADTRTSIPRPPARER